MYVIFATFAGIRHYCTGLDQFTTDPRQASVYEAPVAARFCRDNSSADCRLTFADQAGEVASVMYYR